MKKKMIGAIIVVLVLGLISTAGCIEQGPSPGTGTVKITDSAGRSVEVPKNVKKTVGIDAGAVRLLVYLECADKVVGVEDIEKTGGNPYSYAHPELASLPSIGPQFGGDAEMITGQDPDVIFWTYATEGDANDLQEKTGTPVVSVDYGDLGPQKTKFYNGLRLVAKVMDKEKRAEELISYIDGLITDLDGRTNAIPESEKPGVYVGGIGYYGVHGLLSTEPDYEPLAFVNGKNVAASLGTEHAFVDKEKVLEWNPDIILADQGGLYLIKEDLKDEAYADVKAVKDEQIFGVMPYNYYSTNYGTVLADAYYIGKVLFPDKFTDINPEAKADEIYLKLVGKGVYSEMKTSYGGFGQIIIEG